MQTLDAKMLHSLKEEAMKTVQCSSQFNANNSVHLTLQLH